VAAHNAAIGERITIHTGAVQSLLAATSITAGASVAATTAGQVTAWNTTLGSEVIGIALTTASAGTRVRTVMDR
jgi:hypothetical protein